MAARGAAWRRRLGALVVALGFVVVGPAAAASAAGPVTSVTGAASTAAPGSLALAVKPCAPAPAPNRPTAGLPGKLAPAPPATSPGDPFTDPGVAVSDVYGYSYRWVNYDNGCIPGSAWGPGFITGIGNLALAGASGTNAIVHSTLGFVVDPSWLAPLDQSITQATETVRAGVWAPWITVALLLVAGGVLVAASRADISHAVTSAGWAVLVLVATTYVMSYPISSARAVDGLIQETVTTSARVSSTGGADDGVDDAGSALTLQMDTINRNSLYTTWLEGTLGSSDSAVAEQYGPDLFRASHMTWWEAETLDTDPAAGAAIVEEKKALWTETAAKVETADPLAYQQLTGNQGRWDAALTVTLMTAITMPFLLVAGVFVVIAYTVTRLFIPLAPALGVFGMLELARGWVIAVVGQLGRFLIMGPLYWIGALVNLALISAVFGSDLPYGLQLVIALALPFMLFALFRPKRAQSSVKFLRRMGKMAANAAATRGAVAAGVDDALLGDATAVPRSDGPVAHGPRTREESTPMRPAAATGTAAAAGGAVVATRGTFTARPPAAEPVESRAPGRDVDFVTGGGATYRRAGAAGLQVGRVAVAPADAAGPGGPLRQHPALALGDGSDQSRPRDAAAGAPRAPQRPSSASPVDEDLAAPATPRVLRPEERVPGGIAEANVRDVDGEEVFVLWRPEGASTATLVDADGYGADR